MRKPVQAGGFLDLTPRITHYGGCASHVELEARHL